VTARKTDTRTCLKLEREEFYGRGAGNPNGTFGFVYGGRTCISV